MVGYKQTDIGRIPDDWEIDKIFNLSTITTGSKNTQDRIDDGNFPFFVRSQTVEKINSYSFDGEAVLTAGDGVGTGKIFHYIIGKFDFHQRVYKVSHFSNKLNGFYFYLYFRNHFYNRIMQMTAKSSVDSVRMEMIADMLIPLPPLPEQEAIAEVLSDTDALITALEKRIAKKRLIKQGAMQTLLTPKDDWEVKKLGEVAEIKKGSALSKNKLTDTGIYPCILYGELFTTYKEVINEVVSKTNSEEGIKSKSGDILFPGSTTTTGIDLAKASALLFNNILLGGDIIIVRNIIGYNSEFVSYFLNQISKNEIAKKTKGITIHHLYGNDLRDIEIALPLIQEQTRIATILSDMDNEINALEKKLSKTKELKQGLMQQLLTGKIRLV